MADLQAKAYIFGIPKIDEQHVKFFELTQTLKKFVEDSRDGYQPNHLLSLILRFRNYAFYHFHTEENMLFEKRYPGFFAQKDAHNRFLMEVIKYEEKFEIAYKHVSQSQSTGQEDEAKLDVKDQTEAKNQPDASDLLKLANEMNEFVQQWYHKHILEMDKGYIDYLK